MIYQRLAKVFLICSEALPLCPFIRIGLAITDKFRSVVPPAIVAVIELHRLIVALCFEAKDASQSCLIDLRRFIVQMLPNIVAVRTGKYKRGQHLTAFVDYFPDFVEQRCQPSLTSPTSTYPHTRSRKTCRRIGA
jgi:hypothetical protein